MHRPTTTTRVTALIGATLTGGLLLGLLALGGAQAQNAAPPGQSPGVQAPPPAPQATPATAAQRNAPAARPERRRRTSYAACNRQSTNRGLRGGARRRFLVRCKLGYERPRAVPAQPQTAPARQP
jgi:hypothetical protein